MAKPILIITCHLLLLAVYFNASNSSTRIHTPTIHHGEKGTSNPSTRTRTPTMHHRERGTSNSNTRTPTPTMHHGERGTSNSNTRTHTPTIDHGERAASNPSTRMLTPTIHYEERVIGNSIMSRGILNMHYTQWDLGLDHSLFDHSIHHKWAMSTLTVKDCPSDCYCAFMQDPVLEYLKLVVKDCKFDPIRELPKLFNSHGDVRFLELNSCHLSRLPQDILKLQNLLVLILIKNNFTALPSQVQEMPQLQALWIEANEAELVLTDITKLSELKMLQLNQNRIAALPHEIGNMRSLKMLNVSHNAIQSLPEEIWTLSQLLLLDLSCNEIQSLPQEIRGLSQLQVLSLRFNKLETLPSAIGKLINLFALDLGQNVIWTLPNDLLKLNQLQVIILGHNRLRKVPTLPNGQLSEVYLYHNMIETFPCEIVTSRLDLGYNYVRSFNCVQADFKLSTLSLIGNALEDLQCTYNMLSLKKFILSYNNISKIPEGCAPFTSSMIEWLDLSFNKISTIHFNQFCPEYFSSAFQYLGFRNNRISTIDTTDSHLPRCFQRGSVIDLANNRISSLDSWPLLISETVSMNIDVSGNNLSNFANSAGPFLPTFKSGTTIQLRQNQIRHFMDVFDGWKIIVNTTANLNTLLKNVYFDLGGNPVVCDCIDFEVYKYIQTFRPNHYKNLVCHEPLSLRGQNPHKIPLGNFVCDVMVNCPNSCTCTKVPYSQRINVTCRSYIHTDIPEIMPDLPNENYGYKLDICNQNLREITSKPYLQKAFEILLSNNSITAININFSTALQRVKILHLDNNLLHRLPESVAGMTNESVEEIRLGSNPWLCDCKVLAMKNWIMLNLHIVKDKDHIRCHSPPSMVGVNVKDIKRSMVCPGENRTAVYVVVAIAIVVALILTYFAIVNRFKYANWRLVGSDECEGEHKQFDVFMCSADGDSEFVENLLIPELERRDFRVCYHREHFCGGKTIHDNMSEAIAKSKRTLVFFTNNFKASVYSMFEFNSAYDLDIKNNTRRLVTIRDTDLDMSKLDRSEVHYFETYTYIRLEDGRFWNNLEYSLPRKRLGAQVRQPNT